MHLNEYQIEVGRTAATSKDPKLQACVLGLGIAGEAGETADLVKKHIGHGHPLDLDKLKKEIGDVLWYAAALAAHFGLTLEEVAQANVEKLRKRYPDGFSTEASLARVDRVTVHSLTEAHGEEVPYTHPETVR